MIETILCLLEWLHPELILKHGGLWLLLLVVFLETGIFFGFFLPGDALLLTAGLLTGTAYLEVTVIELIVSLTAAGFLGATAGYIMGYRMGNYLLARQESLFFKKKYLALAESYYLKYGNAAFVLGRFLPIARTFVPIVAGIVKAKRWEFIWFNLIGTSIWVTLFVGGGYWLNQMFPDMIQHLGWMVFTLIIMTSTPLVVTWIKQRRQRSASSLAQVK